MIKTPKIHLFSRGKVYWCSFTVGGKQHRYTTGETDQAKAEKEAQNLLYRALNQLDQNNVNPADMGAKALFEYDHARKLARGRSELTLKNYGHYVKRFCDQFGSNINLRYITRYQIEQWRDWLKIQPLERRKGEYLKPKTIKEHLAWLSGIYAEYYPDVPNPCDRVERPSKSELDHAEDMQFYSVEDMKQILETAKAMKDNEKAKSSYDRYFFWWLVLISGIGCRIGEARIIRFKDIDKEHTTVFLRAKKVKRGRPLNIGWIGRTVKHDEYDDDGELIDVTTIEPETSPWFALTILEGFAHHHYAAKEIEYSEDLPIHFLYNEWFYGTLERCCKLTGVEFKGVHALRHTWASIMLKHNHLSIADIAQFLGHRDISTTYRIYNHIMPQKLRGEVCLFD